ncbi:MAG: hypothetical protein ACW99F_18120 [Candidatus Hodarchaeales archaeon]|jgi:hypothetical protein
MYIFSLTKIIRSACLIILLASGVFIFPNNPSQVNGNFELIPQKIGSSIEAEGVFSIFNSTEEKELLETPIYGTAIGAAWNITILVYSNSSSGLNVTFFSFIHEWWQGKRNFTINPSDSRSEIYIQHGMSDDPSPVNFKYSLINTTNQASGEYIINQTFSGYDTDVGTGHIYVSNITAWLEQMETTSNPPSLWDIFFLPSNVLFGGVVLILISLGFYFRFRKGRKV